ncbi:MOSC domain-containing protein [Brevibacillus laterosporus]|uniref:MOSC domain-containing protein n=1 Tax=Brevibacillus laterosporus TaxID=1465 RepID=A0AAP3GBC8_BRELA|nr:MOSC domain-containing protein [Brevibacillus laterosporus]MCR8980687.1 MOSC domain-containing protein [Brevibacillus laterosporus]MCZ0807842.1 MOSC domain-containing protein [Brevibacillus laterosporus]MCZ0826118.1 MOSC domain-containing protein [Brevibacillus laterosporus]MCZ0849715.1 MOSC domain-containing protein [Brevibacillus laterosporus]
MSQVQVRILSVNVGQPQVLPYKEQEVVTSICKEPVTGPLYLSKTQLQGDAQADLKYHGGVDKAVCVYASEHYPYWEKTLGRSLPVSAFGENLTIEGLLEDEVCIGDIYQIGGAVVQVTQPRQPCHKLAKRYDVIDLAVQVQTTGYTGFYLRVLQEGEISQEDIMTLVEKDPHGVTIAFANQIMHHDKKNKQAIKRILMVEALSASWRQSFTKRLGDEEIDTTLRLQGS